jgi:hypothetical protein
MCIGFRFAATWPTFPTFNGSRLKCPCKKDQSSPVSSQEFRRLPRDEDTLSALENMKVPGRNHRGRQREAARCVSTPRLVAMPIPERYSEKQTRRAVPM